MTTRERLKQMLVNNGMFDTQAESVMELAIPELKSLCDDYKITFDRPASEYPDVIYAVLFAAIRPIALKWINDNIPQAWYKPMFI